MSLSTTDPRKLYRLTPAERTMITKAITEFAYVHLDHLREDEREVAAQIIARMS